MRVCVVGTGYVGLVTGTCLAQIGHHVICIDNNEAKVRLMQSGQSPIYEPGLAEIMQSTMQSGRLEFTTDLAVGVDHGEIIFIAVGTPALTTGESDTRYVEAVAYGIGTHLNGGYKVIVNKSTVPSRSWFFLHGHGSSKPASARFRNRIANASRKPGDRDGCVVHSMGKVY